MVVVRPAFEFSCDIGESIQPDSQSTKEPFRRDHQPNVYIDQRCPKYSSELCTRLHRFR
jgi:hypothetical protein